MQRRRCHCSEEGPVAAPGLRGSALW